ncbi:hypothetical protein LX36DRAFT_91796 [Colletotrichum falcatum]|nr:hypothetical protein LX36DRAFT_91796 [Colletotrichum falcatum]
MALCLGVTARPRQWYSLRRLCRSKDLWSTVRPNHDNCLVGCRVGCTPEADWPIFPCTDGELLFTTGRRDQIPPRVCRSSHWEFQLEQMNGPGYYTITAVTSPGPSRNLCFSMGIATWCSVIAISILLLRVPVFPENGFETSYCGSAAMTISSGVHMFHYDHCLLGTMWGRRL